MFPVYYQLTSFFVAINEEKGVEIKNNLNNIGNDNISQRILKKSIVLSVAIKLICDN